MAPTPFFTAANPRAADPRFFAPRGTQEGNLWIANLWSHMPVLEHFFAQRYYSPFAVPCSRLIASQRPIKVSGASATGRCRRLVHRRAVAGNRRRLPLTANGPVMLRYLATALLGLLCFETSAASAVDCFPHCDFYNNYGPYVMGPTLYCNPRCALQGNCSPFLVCTQQSHRIRQTNPATSAPCLADSGRCTSNYQCCSGSCNWSQSAHAYFCGTSGLLFSKHPPRPNAQ